MKKYFILLVAVVCLKSFASDPEVILTNKSSYNGYATVAGKVVTDRKGLVGVSVDNGGVRYSTIADPSGAWALVFRHAAVNFTIRAWLAESPSVEVRLEDQLALNSQPAGACSQ